MDTLLVVWLGVTAARTVLLLLFPFKDALLWSLATILDFVHSSWRCILLLRLCSSSSMVNSHDSCPQHVHAGCTLQLLLDQHRVDEPSSFHWHHDRKSDLRTCVRLAGTKTCQTQGRNLRTRDAVWYQTLMSACNANVSISLYAFVPFIPFQVAGAFWFGYLSTLFNAILL